MLEKDIKLNPQAQVIYQILRDMQWHCPKEWGYADGHCKRITDINRYIDQFGQEIDSRLCDCGRHTSKILKRRIKLKSENLPQVERKDTETNEHPRPMQFVKQYKVYATTVNDKYCCGSRMDGKQEHSKDCGVLKKQAKEIINVPQAQQRLGI